MNLITFYKLSGIFIIAVGLAFTISQIGITKIFNYPDILRSSTDTILTKFQKGGAKLRLFWALFAFASLMLIPLSAIFYRLLNRSDCPYITIVSFLGIAAEIFYVLGLMRWVLLADMLADKYLDKNTDTETKRVIDIVFQSFHTYCGNSIGETMGFLCMGLWIVITGISMLSSSIFPEFIAIGYIVCGLGILIAPLEWFGFKYANKINKISMKLFMIFLLCSGINLVIFY